MYQSTFSQLPKRTLDYLEYGAPEGQRNDELFQAAQQFRDGKIGILEAKAELIPRAELDGLSRSEAETAINSAYRGEQRDSISRRTQQRKPKFRKIETAPEELPEYIPDGDRALIEAAFEPGELVWIGDTFENEEGERNPDYGVPLTRESWLSDISQRGEINKVMGDQYGLYVRVNPMRRPTEEELTEAKEKKTSIPLDRLVTSFRHALIEADKGSKESQLGALRRIGLPITAIIDSGGRSVHAWVWIGAKDREEYRQRVALLHQFCRESLGLEVDPQNTNPSRYSRMPNGNRMRMKADKKTPVLGPDGKPIIDRPRLLAFNVPGKSWDEWSSEVRAMVAEAEDEKTFTVSGLLNYDLENDPSSLIGNRWLCEGSSLLITGPTGVGKSSFIMTLAVDWALGERPFGLAPARPLKSLIIQAENDEGDLATPLQGLLSSRNLSKAQISELNERIIFKQVATKTGEAFAAYLRAQIEKYRPDIVIADPLLSYAGCDVSAQKDMSKFLRADIQPILNETGVVLAFVHHTGKPPKRKVDADEERRSIYDSLGSTDLTNWAREIVTISYEDWEKRIFKLEFQKRAKRAGIVDGDGKPIYSLRIQHSKDRVAWGVLDGVRAGKSTTKAQSQRSGRVKEVQDWVRETIIEYGDISQSTLKMRGGADLGHPPQMFVDAAELLAEHNSGSNPIRRYPGKDGKVHYTTAPKPENNEPAPEPNESRKTQSVRLVREYIAGKEFVTLPQLKAWARMTDGAPGSNSIEGIANAICEDAQEPRIYTERMPLSLSSNVKTRVYSAGKPPWECKEAVRT